MSKKDIVKKKKNEVIYEAKIEETEADKTRRMVSVVMVIMTTILVILSIGSMYFHFEDKINNKITKNNNKFKLEYEQYNNKKTDMGKTYLSVNIKGKNIIKYSSYDEIFKILENGTGIIYFGFPECPWCRNLVESLLEAANDVGVDKIYYLNNKNDRDIKKLENNKIVTEEKGTDNYYKLLKKLDSVLGPYEGLNDDNIKRLYFPTLLFVKDGEIVDYHIGTLSSQDDPFVPLTTDQYNELKKVIEQKIKKIIICDEGC